MTGFLEEEVHWKRGQTLEDNVKTLSDGDVLYSQGNGVVNSYDGEEAMQLSAAAVAAVRRRHRPRSAAAKTADRTVMVTLEGSNTAVNTDANQSSARTGDLQAQSNVEPKCAKASAGSCSNCGSEPCSCEDSAPAENSRDSAVWTQTQQKTLEWALAQYPKGTAERWEKIAEHITGKTKVCCLVVMVMTMVVMMICNFQRPHVFIASIVKILYPAVFMPLATSWC